MIVRSQSCRTRHMSPSCLPWTSSKGCAPHTWRSSAHACMPPPKTQPMRMCISQAIEHSHRCCSLQVLLRCLKGEAAPDYLAVLVSMELSLHSLEVVSRLTSALDLPQDFINQYIANCIASCDRAEVSLPPACKHALHQHLQAVTNTPLSCMAQAPALPRYTGMLHLA